MSHTKRHDNLIGGEWVAGTAYAPNVNPSDTSDVLGDYAQGDAAQVEAAVAAARAAFPAWSVSGIQARADALDRIGTEILARRDELGTLLAREEGKVLPEAVGEVARAGNIFRFFAGECLRLAGETLPSVRPGIGVEVTREPLGVIGLVTPWNFPIAIPAWKIAPALAYGNCVVVKPADAVPGCAWALAEIIGRSGIPAGVFNLVMGRGSVIGEALVNHPGIDAISFTGSQAVGRRVAQQAVAAGKKVQLEMGGKNPQVILDDADLKTAVELSANSAFFSTGQRCTASSRLIVTEGIHQRFVAALAERTRALRVGAALDAGTDIGPVVSQAQLDQDLDYVAIGQRRGRAAARRRRARRAADGRLLHGAGALRRDERRHAHQPRGDLRAGGERDPRARLRGGAGHGQRHAVRARRGHRHHLAQARHALQAPFAGGHGDGQPADRRRRLPRALRRPQGLVVRAARAGAPCGGVLYRRQDGLHAGLKQPAACPFRSC